MILKRFLTSLSGKSLPTRPVLPKCKKNDLYTVRMFLISKNCQVVKKKSILRI